MPLITITHNFGGDGVAVARKVAEGLGWELFDDTKLHALIERQGISTREIHQLSEKSPGYWELFYKNRPQVFLSVVESVVLEAAKRGDGVIVGHGSQILLRDFDCAMHVRILDSEIHRAERLALSQGLGREAAEKLIRRRDREQSGFYKFAFQIDIDDFTLYDLVIHTQKLNADTAAGLIIAAARSDDIRTCSLNALETMQRQALEKKIHAALLENRIDACTILVEVSEGGVTSVAGVCPNAEDKKRIENIIGSVVGVSKVDSAVQVVKAAV
ncbi:MAG: cytidylate kinase family protein [Desulfobacterales bacterium]